MTLLFSNTSAAGAYRPVANARPLLICFSHLRWDFVFQRPQHIMTRAAADYDVVFVEEPIDADDGLLDWKIRTDNAVTVATPLLPPGGSHEDRISLQAELVDRMLKGRRPEFTWYYTPMALEFSAASGAAVIVYDNMDELALFHGADSRIRQQEAMLLDRADIVFTGGHSLYQAKKHLHHNIHPVPSSIDVAHFQPTGEPIADPADQAHIAHPRIGFFGVIDERMDMALVGALADACPDKQFIMVGPTVKIDPASRPERANIHWLGGKSYAALPGYLHHWDCGFMPFALNDSTRFISPTKTPEFLAAGLPVVSTAITDVKSPYGDLGLVGIADDAAGFARAIDTALAMAANPAWLARVAEQLQTSSWDSTWARMKHEIDTVAATALETENA
jgi:glycosyltransferase involved in cell wall biosynthesis